MLKCAHISFCVKPRRLDRPNVTKILICGSMSFSATNFDMSASWSMRLQIEGECYFLLKA